jgi:hypothetical protein
MEVSEMTRTVAFAIAILLLTVSMSYAGKALVRVYFDNPEHQKAVISEFEDVAGWGGNRYADIVIPTDRLGELMEIAPNHEILIRDVDQYMRQRNILGVGSAYHTQEETYSDMHDIETAHPDICSLQSIGTSIEGRDIWAMKVSDNVGTTENEPRVLYVGCHHAREIITVEIPLYILYWLTDNYGTDSLATYLVDNREIWIVPLMNPDGREYVQNVGDWRKNRRHNGDGSYGVDVNRNYGYMWGYDDVGSSPTPSSETYRGTAGFSEPETQAIRDLLLEYRFDTAVSYHSYGRLVLYPWGYTHDPCADNDIFAALGDSMAALNGYAPGPGAGLYLTNGDSDDWMYGEQVTKDKVYSYTFEVGTEFYPTEDQIIPLCQANFGASLLAAIYADNITRILAPRSPVIDPMTDDSDGVYTVSWTPDASDTVNQPVKYALMERTGAARITDDVEAGDIHWQRNNFKLSTSRYHSGAQSFYGGHTNDRNARLTSGIPLAVEAGDTLSFWTWYAIEENWDYAYVEVSSDGGGHFYSIPGSITTDYDPNGSNAGNGITGSSGSWIMAEFPLSAYADSTILVRFRYKTDSYVLEEGIYVDDIFPVQTFDSSAVLSDAILNPYYEVTRAAGTYYYEVKAADADGQWGPWSQRESITVIGAGIKGVDTQASRRFPNPIYLGRDVSVPFQAGSGTVCIFDIRGRVVRTLDASGTDALWDLKDTQGNLVAPGVYFVNSAGDGKVAARKVVILK